MSMLAERKRKQKWCLNPRGQLWSSDSNKFGQKMLEKMGWKEGKGLGANEDGRTENIKINYKNDSKGMGFKETEDWLEHDDNFSALLQQLSTQSEIKTNESDTLKSLEEKSQKSRTRVHYHKFTRGKDLSRYSKKDLANIFGKKQLVETPKESSSSFFAQHLEDNYDDYTEDSQLINESNQSEKKQKPKKKRKNKEIEDSQLLLEECDSVTENQPLKKKKKKK